MCSELTPSYNGKYLVVSYCLKVFIRHRTNMGIFARGKTVTMPMWISYPSTLDPVNFNLKDTDLNDKSATPVPISSNY